MILSTLFSRINYSKSIRQLYLRILTLLKFRFSKYIRVTNVPEIQNVLSAAFGSVAHSNLLR